MPAYSGKRSYDMANKRGGGSGGRSGGNQRRDDRRYGSMQDRISGLPRAVMSPWENGVTPGMQSSLLGHHNSFGQPAASAFYGNPGLNRGNFPGTSFGGFGSGSNKIRRMDRMGSFDDHRGRGLLPSPNAPLLGIAPPAFQSPAARASDYLQQRMSNPWESSFHSGGPRGLANSGYYPSNRGRQDNRKFIKAKRPMSKTSSSSNSRDGKGKGRGAPKSPSTKEREDKEKSSHSKEAKSKQGDSSSKAERAEGKDDDSDKEEKTKDEEENDSDKDEAEKKRERENEERIEKEKQLEDQFPCKALYCHICELDNFSSKKGYIRHLQGLTHAKMAELFHAKNAASLELLNISAKLAEMRQKDKVLRRTGKKNQPVMKTAEQLLVTKCLKVGSCCGTKYKSPFGLEEHKLSIQHLKAKYMQKQKQVQDEEKMQETEEGKVNKDDKEEDIKEEDDGEEKENENEEKEKEKTKERKEKENKADDSHDEILRWSSLLNEAVKESETDPMALQTLPVYNPSEMIGLEFVKKEIRFHCRVCRGQAFKSLDLHCQAHTHYDSIASHLNKMEDMKMEEKRKAEEAEKEKAKIAAEKKAALAEKEKKKKKEAEEAEKKAAEEGDEEDEEEDEDEDDDVGSYVPEDFQVVDCSEDAAKDKSDDEDDVDVVPLGEEEERILNEENDEKEEEERLEDMETDIFEEIGEKIEFEEGKSVENGKEEDDDDDEEKEKESAAPKKLPHTPRKRGRAKGKGRSTSK